MSKNNTQKNVLIVEDEEALRKLIKEKLEDSGFNVTEASSSEEGKAFFDAKQFDCILLDLMLPMENGLKTLEHIRSKSENIPVIIISAHATYDNLREAIQKKSTDFLKKPFLLSELLECMNKAMKDAVPDNNALLTNIAKLNLTERESEIVKDVIQGLSNDAIANKRKISVGTVKGHMLNIFRKNQFKSRHELIATVMGTNS